MNTNIPEDSDLPAESAESYVYHVDHDFGRRFELAWKTSPLPYREMKQYELARAFDISHQAVHTYIKGTRIPLIRNGVDICKRLNVSIAWLYMNEGPMRPVDLNSFSSFTKEISELNEAQRKLIQWEVNLMKKGQVSHETIRDAIIQAMS